MDFLRLRADEQRDLPASLVNRPARLTRGSINTAGVGKAIGEVRQHGGKHLGLQGRRRRMIHVNHPAASSGFCLYIVSLPFVRRGVNPNFVRT